MATTLERATESDSATASAQRGGGGTFWPTPAGWAARASVPVGVLLATYVYAQHYAEGRSDFLSQGVILAIGALSLNVLVGYIGQISLGHQAFIGIGAFTSAYIISRSHQSFYVALIVSAAVGAVQAVLLGLIALRVRGLYFALVTLSWGAVAESCIFRIKGFTGGGAGADAPRPAGFGTDRSYFIICVIVLAIILLIDWRMMATKAGRAMQAIRESPQVAANYGVNVKAYTLYAFAIAGVYAGVAGALFASRRTSVVTNDFQFSLIALPFLIVTVVGGLRRRGGIVVFSMLYILGGEYLPNLAKLLHLRTIEANAGYAVQALSGILAILTLIFQPDGLGTITAPVGRWLKGGRFDMGHGGGAGAEGISARP